MKKLVSYAVIINDKETPFALGQVVEVDHDNKMVYSMDGHTADTLVQDSVVLINMYS